MNDNRINGKIRIPLLQFAPAFLVGAFLIVAALKSFGSPSPVVAQTDTTAPTVSSVAITSDPDDDIREDVPYRARGGTRNVRPSGIYGIGDDIEVTVTFDEDVTVTGSPKLDLDIGGRLKTADYFKAEGSAVVFSYTVAEGDSDTDGVAIDANKLKLNGGSIKDDAGNDADLTHDALAAQANHEVDGIRPKISLRFMNTGWGADGFHTAGELIWVEIRAVASDLDPGYSSVTGPPQLMLDFDGVKKAAEWVNYRNPGATFEYEIQEGDLDTDGVAIKADSISLNGGFIKDQAGNDAILTHAAAPANSGIVVDAVVPTVSSLAITSDPGEDDTYDTGDKIEVTVTFSENVTIPDVGHAGSTRTHRPYLELDIGGEAKTADYQNHRGPAVVFSYNVRAGDSDEDGISIGANKLHLDGGLIHDAAWNNPVSATLSVAYLPLDAVVSHDAVADKSDHKVTGSPSPLTLRGPTIIKYKENSVSFFDPEGKRVGQYYGRTDDVTWSLSGDDGSLFYLKDGNSWRTLWFNSPPNYEDPEDADADNIYRVTIDASDGTNSRSLEVVVVVTNDWLDSDEVPVITGTPQVGETLTADVSRISGPTEFSEGTFNYGWVRLDGTTDTRIDGADGSTYTLTAEDKGKRIKVVAVGRLGYYSAGDKRRRHSEPTAVVTAPGQTNSPASGQPAISGTAQVGETLTADTSDISDDDGLDNATFSHQWLAGDAEISGATSSTYTLAATDEGKAVKVRVSFTDDAGYDETLTSGATAAVAAAPPPPTDPPPAPTNLVVSDNGNGTLTLTWDAPDEDSVTGYQVLRRRPNEGEKTLLIYVADTGSTDTTWTDRDVTIGTQHVYRVKAINTAGLSQVSFYAKATPALPPENSPATGAPTITGTARVGETLTAGTSGISDDNGLNNATFGYQWLADDADISGATSSAYTLAAADEGKAVKVRVSFTDDAGHDETLTSGATAAVAALQPDLASVSVILVGRPSGTYTGETFTLSAGLQNDGAGASAATTLRYYQSTDATIDTSDTEVGTDDVAALAAAERASESEELTAPDTAGTYYYGACVDSVAGESDTTNNCSSGLEVVVLAWNSPATGAATITGTAQVGKTLTADTSGISDDDGLTNAAFSYQWLADEANISGATRSTYTLADADESKALKVQVSFTDDAGNDETLTSAATAAVAPPPLTASFENVPAEHDGKRLFSFELHFSENFPGRMSYKTLQDNAFQVENGRVRKAARVVKGENRRWTISVRPASSADVIVTLPASLDCSATGAVCTEADRALSNTTTVTVRGPVDNTPAADLPTITGMLQVGETLTANTSGIADADGLDNATFSYQWLAGDADISGATGSTYTLTDADEGKAVKVRVSFTDDAGNDETLASAATAAVAPRPNNPATGEPTILGEARVGETLTADTSGISDADGLDNAVFSYQWLADDADISGAAGSTYTLADADEGRAIKVRVSFTDDAGNDETLTSAATSAVAAAVPPDVAGVAVTSAPSADNTYALGETIRVTLTFSEAVAVTGAPRLKIDMDPAHWGGKWARYESGSGTAELTFAYTVAEPNESTQGIAVLANTLELNGGTIESASSGTDADLSHAALAHDANHKVDWRPEPATVTVVAVVSDAGDDDTYGLGDAIRVRVTFSEAVAVDASGGNPRLKIDMDPAHWGGKWAVYEGGSGTTELTFAYTVAEPNESTQGIAVLANTLELNGGTIESASSRTDADLAYDGLDHDPAHKVDWES